MEKVGHLRVRQFCVPFARETWKKVGHLTILRRTICEGNMEKVGHLRVRLILRRTICEGNMEKVGHLRVLDNFQFYGVPFARETWKKWATWGFDNFTILRTILVPFARGTWKKWTTCEGNMEKVGHLMDNFKAYHLRGKHGKSGPLEGLNNFKAYHLTRETWKKVGHLMVRQFYGVPFARETWKKWATWGFDNFMAYHLRGKHGKSGPLEGSTILWRTICVGKI